MTASILVPEYKYPHLLNRQKGNVIVTGWLEIPAGDATLQSEGDVDDHAPVTIYSIYWTTFSKISDKDAEWFGGYQSWIGVLKHFQEQNPELTQNSPVTVMRYWNENIRGFA